MENNPTEMRYSTKGHVVFDDLLTSIDEDLGRDEDSLNLFEWVLEDHYESKIKNHLDYYKDRPDLFHIANEEILYELDKILNYFIGIEEYEKCSRIVKIKDLFRRSIINL